MLKSIAAFAFAGGLAAAASAQEYPERPINMIIPYGAGGATDISARTHRRAARARSGQAAGDGQRHRGGRGDRFGPASQNAKPGRLYDAVRPRRLAHGEPGDEGDAALHARRFPLRGRLRDQSGRLRRGGRFRHQVDGRPGRQAAEEGGVSYSSSGVGSLLHLAGVMVLDEFGVENPLDKADPHPAQGRRRGGDGGAERHRDLHLHQHLGAGELRARTGSSGRSWSPRAEPVEGFDAPTAADLGQPSAGAARRLDRHRRARRPARGRHRRASGASGSRRRRPTRSSRPRWRSAARSSS